MFKDTGFYFNGKNSSEFGIYNVSLENGLQEEPLWGSRTIIEDKLIKKNRSFLFGIEKQNIELTMTFSLLEEAFTRENKIKIMQWLIQEDYKEFYSLDDPNKVYYVLVIDDGKLFMNGAYKGYFQVRLRTNAPWSFTPVTTQSFDLNNNTSGTTIEVYNNSNIVFEYFPEFEFENLQTINFTILNNTNKGKITQFTGLDIGETIYVNNDRHQIKSSTGLYRYIKFNKTWLGLIQGKNVLSVSGKGILMFRTQFPMIV